MLSCSAARTPIPVWQDGPHSADLSNFVYQAFMTAHCDSSSTCLASALKGQLVFTSK